MTEIDALKKELNEARLNLIIALSDTTARIITLLSISFSLVCLGVAALAFAGGI